MFHSKQRFSYAVLALVMVTSTAANAIQINIRPDSNKSEAPNWDPDGSALLATFNKAARIWEDLIPGGGSYDVSVEWDDDISGLGLWTEDPFGDNIIEINPDFSWYYDGPSISHTAFDMQQKFYRELTLEQQSAWFDGNVPGSLEVGYEGAANTLAAMGRYDMLSVALHELGHELGINFEFDGEFEIFSSHVLGQTGISADANNDISFDGVQGHLSAANTLMVAGLPPGWRRLPSAVDVLTIAGDQGIGDVDLDRKEWGVGSGSWNFGNNWIGGSPPNSDDDAFIRSPTANPTVALFSNSSARNLFVGRGDDFLSREFQLTVGDTVTVDGSGSSILLDQNGGLNATDVVIQNDGQIRVETGGLRASTIRIENSILSGGEVGLVRASSRLVNDGEIRATGGLLFFRLDGSGSPWDLDGENEHGVLRAMSGDLAFEGNLADVFNGELTIGAGRAFLFANTFSLRSGGRMTMRGGTTESTQARYSNGSATGSLSIAQATLEVVGFAEIEAPLLMGSGDLLLGTDGQLIFREGATLSGGRFNVGGDAFLGFESNSQLSGDIDITASGDGVIEFNELTTYAGGSIQMTGAVTRQRGQARVTAPTTIFGSGTWDLDGNLGDTLWNVDDDLTLNVSRLEADANHQFDGRINLNGSGATMTVNTSSDWTMDGRLDLDDGTVLAGSAQMNVTGTINAETSRITAPVSFHSGASVAVGGGDELQLDGTTYFEGGAFRGGTLHQDGAAIVVGTTLLGRNEFIAPPVVGAIPTPLWLNEYDWDGSFTTGATKVTNIQPGASFVINAVQIDNDPSSDGYDGTVNIDGGTLIVNTGTRLTYPASPPGAIWPANVVPTPWRLDGTMNLQEKEGSAAVVTAHFGSPLEIYGEVNATGGNANITGMHVTLTPNAHINVSSGATLNMGLVARGIIDVQQGGLLRLNTPSSLGLDVQMNVDGIAELTSTTDFWGGTHQGQGLLVQSGDAKFNETTHLEVYTAFGPTGKNAIAAGRELQFASDAIVHPGAVFQGTGTVHNLAGSNLYLLDEARIDVLLINDGILSPGVATVDTFYQSATGVLEIEILGNGGMPGVDFDQLIVNNDATLGGLLNVYLGGAFTPSPDDSFEFLRTFPIIFGGFSNAMVGSRVDTADGLGSFQLSTSTPPGSGYTFFELSDFQPNTLPGDFDVDGDRDGRDFLIWQRGGSPNPLSASDLADWEANYGAVASLSAETNAVPEPATWLLAMLFLQMFSSPCWRTAGRCTPSRRRRRRTRRDSCGRAFLR